MDYTFQTFISIHNALLGKPANAEPREIMNPYKELTPPGTAEVESRARVPCKLVLRWVYRMENKTLRTYHRKIEKKKRRD